jgi:hypothetical protein
MDILSQALLGRCLGHASAGIFGVDEMYATTQSRDNGIASVKANGASATVKDLTKP